MRKKNFYLPVLHILSASFIFFSNSCCKPGTGGEANLIVTLQHHGNSIKSKVGWVDTVFVKFNATELGNTAPGNFDKYFVGTTGTYTIGCDGLKCGKYFLYGTAMDSAGPYRVTGGLPFVIKHKDRKQSLDVTLAVTE